ncbi:SDR family oxidoreductase [bacterium]|nr:MAG: SDR family oxidoreductase [bacterium]
MKEKILVTGANGFIGSRLTKRLEEGGAEVVKLDRALLTLPEALTKVMDEVKPNAIYHLAAYGNHYNQKEIRDIFTANLFGVFNLLEASRGRNLDYFVNTGSSSEYGKKEKPMKEDMLPETNTMYGAVKAGATFLAKAYASEYDLPVVTVRPFSVYGPGEADHRFIPTVVRCCLTGEVLKLAPGVHDWIYIDDFINGMITVTENIKQLSGEVVNIGSGQQYSNKEVVEEVERICGITVAKEEVGNIRSFDTITSWVANNEKLRSFGWKPETDLRSGIEKVIDAKRTNQTQKKNN